MAQSTFDVASIKSSQMLVPRNQGITPDGIVWVNVTLADCIAAAWHMKKNQISGPDWLDTDRFDITAKSEHAADPPQLMLMLQGLLSDRFKLTVHQETRERPVYLLTIAKNGPKLNLRGIRAKAHS